MGASKVAVPKFRSAVLIEARERAGLTQLQLATLAGESTLRKSDQRPSTSETARRIRTWESRIGAWERRVDSPSAPYIPTLARLLGVEPLELFEIDSSKPPFTALRFAAGLTLQALAELTGISYTSLHRMLRGVTELPPAAADRLAAALDATPAEILAAIERDR